MSHGAPYARVPRPSPLERVRSEVLAKIGDQPVDVLLYGSWAKGNAGRASDIDIAIDPKGAYPRREVALLREMVEELPVAYPVHIVDLRETGEPFRRQVRKEGIRWKSA